VLIDVAISGDRNVIKEEGEEILKYRDLIIEIQRVRNIKSEVIPVIIGATGTISKSLRQYVNNIPGKHEINKLQKTAVLGIAHLLREVLIKVQNIFNMGNNITCSINGKYTYSAAATLFTPETWFVYSVYNCKYCINMISNIYIYIYIYIFFNFIFCGAATQRWSWPPHS
jgi:hypothetical protein